MRRWRGRTGTDIENWLCDLPLFERVGLAVAVNASPAAADAATCAVEGDDLSMILPYLQAWLAGL